MTTTSISLLQRLRQPGREQDWVRFVQLYTPLLFYSAYRMGLREHDAADLVQDVFTLLVQKLPEFSYDRHKSFRAWLRTVLVNKFRENQRRAVAQFKAGQAAAGVEAVSPDAAAALEEAEYRHHLAMRALQLMKAEFQPTTWQACWEHVVSGRPAAEVAHELGITINAVYLAKSRVLRRLRQELEGLLD